MSDSDQGKRTPLVEWVFPVIGIVLALSLAFGMGTLVRSSSRNPATKQQQQAYAAAQDRYSRAVAGNLADPQSNYSAYPDENADPCYYAANHDSADLCAQWRAAVAAERSARWTEAGFWIGLLGTVLSGAGLTALLISLRQTERSLGEARRGNRIAMKANARATRQSIASNIETQRAIEIAAITAAAAQRHAEVALLSSKKSLRAYLAVDNIEVKLVSASAVSVEVFIVNKGSTPARVLDVKHKLWIGPVSQINPMDSGPVMEKYWHLPDWLPHGSLQSILSYNQDVEDISKINEESVDTYAYGRIEYADAFDDRHWFTYCYRVKTHQFCSASQWVPCVHGNDGD